MYKLKLEKMKPELKHLAPYLPYGVQFNGRRKGWVNYCENMTLCPVDLDGIFEQIKPILRPLSQLTEEIEHNGEKFVPLVKLAQIGATLGDDEYKIKSDTDHGIFTCGIMWSVENDDDNNMYEVFAFDDYNGFGRHYRPSKEWDIVLNQMQINALLYEWHFDVYSLIEKGLAIKKQ